MVGLFQLAYVTSLARQMSAMLPLHLFLPKSRGDRRRTFGDVIPHEASRTSAVRYHQRRKSCTQNELWRPDRRGTVENRFRHARPAMTILYRRLFFDPFLSGAGNYLQKPGFSYFAINARNIVDGDHRVRHSWFCVLTERLFGVRDHQERSLSRGMTVSLPRVDRLRIRILGS